jgi:pyridoxamine 5'-phosphate oxidase
VAEYTLQFGLGEIPRPAFWSGFRVLPRRIEFWRDMPFRLHERMVFHREGVGAGAAGQAVWRTETLYP